MATETPQELGVVMSGHLAQSIQRGVPVGPVRLVGAGTVRLLDLSFVYEVADGVVGSLELSDIGAQHGPAPVPGRRW